MKGVCLEGCGGGGGLGGFGWLGERGGEGGIFVAGEWVEGWMGG